MAHAVEHRIFLSVNVAQTVSTSRRNAPADAIDMGKVRRALVIMLRHHGDVLLTTPVLSVLKRLPGTVEVDALVYSDTSPLLEFNPDLTTIHRVDRGWKRQGIRTQLREESRLLSALRRREFDLVVHLTNHRRGAWLVRLLQPRHAVAPRLRHQDWFWRTSFTHLYPSGLSVEAGHPLSRRHMAQQNLDALRRIGIEVALPPALTLVPGAAGESDAQEALGELVRGQPYTLVQPTSRWMFKTWPVENNAALVERLLARGKTVVLSCGPDEREQRMVADIVALLPSPSSNLKLVVTAGTLNRLAALIEHAELFIGIDSAPMHMAAALGTPLIALFGPSGEDNWGPWSGPNERRMQVLTSDDSCRPCGQDGCGGGKVSECLRSVSVDRVLAAADALAFAHTPAAP